MKNMKPAIEPWFNLLDEPWILVLLPEGDLKEVSLKELFMYAHEYVCLAGEMETQNAAVFRVLLSILMSVFYRWDSKGEYAPLDENGDEEDALDRWTEIWDLKHFPVEVINQYLEDYRDCFWLVHPEKPFWQIADLQYGTDYDVKTLFGDIKESQNIATMHHFSQREGDSLSSAGPAEAARWLIHLNAYAVNIKYDKNAGGNKEAIGVGRLGQTGFIMARGSNLYETLMLNLTMLRDGESGWAEPKPVWERKRILTDQNHRMSVPDNIPELYTIQSRRIRLIWKDGKVTGYKAMGGEYLDGKHLFTEQMSMWRKREDKKSHETWMEPNTHSPGMQAWREFPLFIHVADNEHCPGIIRWIEKIQNNIGHERLPVIKLQTVGMTYGGMSYNYAESFSDSIGMASSLLFDLGEKWRTRIVNEINTCQTVAGMLLGKYADDICRLLYGDNTSIFKNKREALRHRLEEYYYELIDKEFREWLLSIDPEKDTTDEKIIFWRKISDRAARKTAYQQASELEHSWFTARRDDTGLYSIPAMLSAFLRSLNRIYTGLYKTEEEENDEKTIKE